MTHRPDHSDLIANATFQDKDSSSRMNSYEHGDNSAETDQIVSDRHVSMYNNFSRRERSSFKSKDFSCLMVFCRTANKQNHM